MRLLQMDGHVLIPSDGCSICIVTCVLFVQEPTRMLLRSMVKPTTATHPAGGTGMASDRVVAHWPQACTGLVQQPALHLLPHPQCHHLLSTHQRTHSHHLGESLYPMGTGLCAGELQSYPLTTQAHLLSSCALDVYSNRARLWSFFYVQDMAVNI